jgi:hypothetical protein
MLGLTVHGNYVQPRSRTPWLWLALAVRVRVRVATCRQAYWLPATVSVGRGIKTHTVHTRSHRVGRFGTRPTREPT